MIPSPERNKQTYTIKWVVAVLTAGALVTMESTNYVALSILGVIVLHEAYLYGTAFRDSRRSESGVAAE